MECGQEFLERNGDLMFRIGDETQPSKIQVSIEPVTAICGKCAQLYTLTVAMTVTYERDQVPLYLQPQSIYLSVEEHKRLRYVHCMECGKAFHSISDRISNVVDNRVPFEYLSPTRLGPIEALCSWNKCGQTWAFVL